MTLFTLGLNHKTAPVEIRERLTFGPDVIAGALRSLGQQPGVEEALILSTCNRTEIYAVIGAEAEPRVRKWLSDFHGLPRDSVNPYLYHHQDLAGVQHLLRVSSGLDSMVLGEPQILGQVKSAFKIASQAGATGKLLGRLFQHAFAVAKQVRTDTSIGTSPVSVAFAAVSLARQIFSDLSQQCALLIGAGETIELAARHLHQHGIGRMVVANRTVERAQGLAGQFDAYAIALTELSHHLAEADIVISSTASPLPVLGKGAMESALKKRKHRPVFLVDIAVPRDIEAEVGELEDAYLYTVDDLQEVVEDNMRSRWEAAKQAEEIVELNADEFMGWVRSLDAVSLVQGYRGQAEAMRDEVLQRALRQLANGKPADETLRYLAHTLTNKLIHVPSTRIRQAGAAGENQLLEAANTLLQVRKSSDAT
jgi:glutamyl-tRNA reductase